MILASALTLVVALAVGGWGQFSELFSSLAPGVVGGIALACLCLALLPNLAIWMVAYLAGPGFVVGTGTEFSPFATVGSVQPALPLLGLLPRTQPPPVAVALILVPVLAGLVAGWMIQRRLRQDQANPVWWQNLIGAVLASGLAAAAAAGLVALSGGSGGPGRLVLVGASFWPLAGWLWLELGVGATIGACVLSRPWRRAAARLSAGGDLLTGRIKE
jgi:hypothetical protein